MIKSIIIWGDSGHSNYINPFEYGRPFPDILFLKGFRTLTQTKPEIHRGADKPPPPIFKYAQIGQGNYG